MTRLLRKYVFGTDEDEHIIKDWRLRQTASFDDIVLNMFSGYLELSTQDIANRLGLILDRNTAKNINASVTRKILGITGDPDRAEEFKNANVAVKTIVVDRNNHPEQNMSFPGFSFLDILDQEWEDSDVYYQMAASRFLFVVFERENTTEIPVLKKVFFWNMPTDDIEELHRVWKNAKKEIRNGANLHIVGQKVRNSLPKESESYLAHVRPHSDRAAYILSDGTVIGNQEKDANPLPDGQWMTTQCFWFNKDYMQKIIADARKA
jgi:DNA mismatch repair protein MutH